MWFWWFMFFCNLLITVTFIVGGRMMWKHCPKEINGIVGYKTKRSMKNMDTWKFAHDYCGHLWWNIGWMILVLSILVYIPFFYSSQSAIGILGGIICVVQCIILIVTIFPTEHALKKTFYDDGTRR